jgi:hypothetical protein
MLNRYGAKTCGYLAAMESQPAKPAYFQPLLTNFLLLILTGLAYLNLRTHDVSYGNGISHPELGDVFFFGLTFLIYPLVNFSLALLSKGRQAVLYGILGALSSALIIGLVAYISEGLQKIGG